MLAPLLYVLVLGGLGAVVMFSGYNQVLRSNAEITAINAARSQLQWSGQALSSTTTLNLSVTPNAVTPPQVEKFANVKETTRLPEKYADAGQTGRPHDVGVLDSDTGLRRLDPWGKYYIYCRWESHVANLADPGITLISAGPDGVLSTRCGDRKARNDDQINSLTVAEVVNRSNAWQVSGGNQHKFGAAGTGEDSAISRSLAFLGDLDTGFFQSTPNTLSIAAGGVEAAHFNTATGGVNYLDVTPSARAGAVRIATAGVDDVIPLALLPKGAGGVGVGAAEPRAQLHLSGNRSAASWGKDGTGLRIDSAIYTDINSDGRMPFNYVHAIGQPTLAANGPATYSNAATLYLAGEPVGGANVTLIKPWALYVERGDVYLGGKLNLSANLGDASAGQYLCIDPVTHVVTRSNACVAADSSLTKDVVDLRDALEKVTSLRGVAFTWKDEARGRGVQLGLRAQDVETVYPEAVTADGAGLKSVNYSMLVAPLVEAVKALNAENKALRTQLDDLSKKYDTLEKKLNARAESPAAAPAPSISYQAQ